MKLAALLLAGIMAPIWTFAQTQSAADLVAQGDAAAHDDHHAQAIAAYEAAMRLDSSLRDPLLAKIGRQYLWSDQSRKASGLLGAYLKEHPEDCDVQMDYALALSWSNQNRQALGAYREIGERCPKRKLDALLGEARILRWMDRPSHAARLYRDIAEKGNTGQQQEAALGLALTDLARDNNRSARQAFANMLSDGYRNGSVYEGLAAADWHLGMGEQSLADVSEARRQGFENRRLHDFGAYVGRTDRPMVAPTFLMFHDADGTTYFSGEARAGFGLRKRARFEAFTGASALQSGPAEINAQWGGGAVEFRFNPSFAIRGEAKGTAYTPVNFSPFSGEVDAVITPGDKTRFDLALARILIADNLQALNHHLIGSFESAGVDQRVTSQFHLSGSMDATEWSEDNRRTRLRLSPYYQFEGVQRLTISLPVLYQSYDRGFNFALFSPTSYVEIGPAANLYWRVWHYWAFSLYGRLGAQKEAALPWKPLGTFQGQVERELWKNWGGRASVAHSSSNLASASGFSRTSVSGTLIRRF